MKKIISVLIAVMLMISFSSCSNKKTEDAEKTVNETEATTKLDTTIYAETNFESLKTFTEITGIELLSEDKSEFDETSYTYFIAENADELIYQYQEYLRELGFTMFSGNSFSLEGTDGSVKFSTEEVENGKNVTVTVSCDEKTEEARIEAAYIEMENAFLNKDYSAVATMDYVYGYEDTDYYRDYSLGMLAWECGAWGSAYSYLSQCSEKTDVSAYLNEIEKYTGRYNYRKDIGVDNHPGTDYYVFIENGKVALEADTNLDSYTAAILDIDLSDKYDHHYTYPDPPILGYFYELIVTTNDDGSKNISIGLVSSSDGVFECELQYDFVDNKDGTYSVTKAEDSESDHYAGTYTKITDQPIPLY